MSNKRIISINKPEIFNFKHCLTYLDRNENECLHQVKQGNLVKSTRIDETPVVLKICSSGEKLEVEILYEEKFIEEKEIRCYISELFDLNADLASFYQQVKGDQTLHSLANNFYGLRLVGIPALFEAICWAIIGQQINLNFAYQLKRNLVENFGEKKKLNGVDYYFFPVPGDLKSVTVSDLKELKFSRQKAEYIFEIAQLISEGKISKEFLERKENLKAVIDELTKIKGIGNWTANYVALKCLRIPSAFPIEDVGLHNALKNLHRLKEKPDIKKIKQLAKHWKGWEGYAVTYLCHSLL